MHPDERRIYFALLTAGMIVIGLIVFFVITIMRYHRRKVSAYMLTLQQEMQIQETERSRIASDLHDDLNSDLSVIKLRLSFLPTGDPQQKQIIEEMSFYIDKLSDRVRNVSNHLLPIILERQGLQKALEELISPLESSHQYTLDYKFQLSVSPIPETSIHVYRIFQEIVSNVLKHSQASQILFYIFEDKGTIYIHAEDNGIGFDLNARYPSRGLGLQNIRMRTDIIHAKLYITSSRGNGVRYNIEIPKEFLFIKP